MARAKHPSRRNLKMEARASDIDLLIVEQPDQVLLPREIRKAERVLRREVG